MTKNELRIVSGGQTGVDRGALQAAMALGLDWGGWAPKGWRAENGPIPASSDSASTRYKAARLHSGVIVKCSGFATRETAFLLYCAA